MCTPGRRLAAEAALPGIRAHAQLVAQVLAGFGKVGCWHQHPCGQTTDPDRDPQDV